MEIANKTRHFVQRSLGRVLSEDCGPERLCAALFTGPDGIREHRVSVDSEHRYVGEGTMSNEGTSEVEYLWRAPSWLPHPRPKSHRVGEIGWGVPKLMDWSAPTTGVQIKLGEFRQAVEDRHTHSFQNAWYPGPGETNSGDRTSSALPPIQQGSRANSANSQTYSEHSQHSHHSSRSGSVDNTNNNNNNNNNSLYRGGPYSNNNSTHRGSVNRPSYKPSAYSRTTYHSLYSPKY